MRGKTVDVTAVRLCKQNQASWATGAADMHTYKRATHTQARLTDTGVLYRITRLPTGRAMNLHSERSGQRQRTGPRLHNDCSESVLVMWFVTPSALSLIWLRGGLGPAVSNEMVASDRRRRAGTRKRPARLQSVSPTRTPGTPDAGNATTAEVDGARRCVCVSGWTERSWQHSLHRLSFLSLKDNGTLTHALICLHQISSVQS